MVQDRKLTVRWGKASGPNCGGSQKPGIVLKPRDGKEPLHTEDKRNASVLGLGTADLMGTPNTDVKTASGRSLRKSTRTEMQVVTWDLKGRSRERFYMWNLPSLATDWTEGTVDRPGKNSNSGTRWTEIAEMAWSRTSCKKDLKNGDTSEIKVQSFRSEDKFANRDRVGRLCLQGASSHYGKQTSTNEHSKKVGSML